MEFPKTSDPDFAEKRRAYARAYMKSRYQDPALREKRKARKALYRASEKGKATEAAYQASYKPDPQKSREHSFRRHHGVTRDQADRMIEAQGGICALCRQPPKGKGHCGRLHVDHDAETGAVRAMLCSFCNQGLGHFRHSPELLAAAIAYLVRCTAAPRAHVEGAN